MENSLETKMDLPATKFYKKRWIILLIYVLYSAANSFQWMEYSIIANIVMRFYDVDASDVDWTSIIYMLIYPIIVIPVSYFIEKKGLRFAALCGGLGTALAAFIKVFSVKRGLFYLVLLGQGIGSTAQVFVLSLPSKIAAVWFKPEEVSTACALAVFGTQIGFALGFVVPSSLVKNHDDLNLVAWDLKKLCWIITIYMIPVGISVIFFFSKQPRIPPTLAQWEERHKRKLNFSKYLKHFSSLFSNHGFVCHTIAYGINIGVFAAIGTLLNQFILEYFPNSEEDAGRIGLIMVLGGICGSVVFGVVLDKTHKYKVFTNAYMPVGYELAVEITYPADESTTTGILNATTQAFGVIITIFLGKFNSRFGAFWSLGSQAALLLLGAVLTCFVPNKKLRQEKFFQEKIARNELQILKENEK
ncbi:uncharacterized MFS-type transporter C09D4.1-like isoform X2 [Sitophilus oryzae]|uniref:Uncharacterized MFS-type transporter C09D4.1-like isoform X2 n=1 Tax=Sitophilus oryzae TaxID=7048 RepID=A0A6J2XKN9_SITOR|nr:uncharacterized MFS-type transporter C09D4.1-like isoform X2 [Sitophilus oryzae]